MDIFDGSSHKLVVLTGAGEQVPAAQVLVGGAQQVLGAAETPETQVPRGGGREEPWCESSGVTPVDHNSNTTTRMSILKA